MLSNALPRGLSIAAIIVALDQLSKYWIIEKVMRPEGVDFTPFHSATRIEILPFFHLVMAWNRGVSFGIGNNGGEWNAVILSALAVAICVGMIIWLAKAETWLVQVALGGIIGGALGNVIDRARFGAVADFLDVHVAGYHWPAFNVADSAITVGAVFLVVDSLFGTRDSSKN
jgi:signal peptidase II